MSSRRARAWPYVLLYLNDGDPRCNHRSRCVRGIAVALPRCRGRICMHEQGTIKRARRDKLEGKSPSTQAGEFVREEMHHIREGKHGARSTKQAIAIGLSKARRSGVKLGRPPAGAKASTKRSAQSAAKA